MPGLLKVARGRLNDKALPWVLRNKFSSNNINIAATANVALFPKLNLAFNRVKKNGNSTTVSLLYAMETGKFVEPLEAKRGSAHLRTAKVPLLLSSESLFYFVIIRDPYSRTLSAFLNKFKKPSYIDRFGSFEISPAGFTRFLIWLAESGLDQDAHWDLQKKLIVSPLEAFDTALRFEEFPDCLVRFLRDRGLKLPIRSETILTGSHQGTRTGAKSKMEQFYSKESIAIAKSLFKDDFEFLGYSDHFLDAVRGQTIESSKMIS